MTAWLHDAAHRGWEERILSLAPKIRVVVVEDDAATRAMMASALRSGAGLELVAECPTLAAAMEAIRRCSVDVLLVDLTLPDGHGRELIEFTSRTRPAVDIMVVSVLGDAGSVVDAISAGASGFLLKDSTELEIINAVRDLRMGKSPISAAVAAHIVKLVQTPKSGRDPGVRALATLDLTKREIDTLWGIAKGFTYREIAETLGVSPNTVPTHIKNIYRKLRVNSRGEAVFEAVQRGIIDLNQRF